ncbi:MAG: disulfide isomerase [Lasallia pustulata]|uniref:protein disulfide-isomerase n=1 Tax=Lasallia pustulata TaxID=136370 RepID=A0A5M8Q4B8_9LECA|nr:MAG: disulfide isomerase [Lasallia pustulata]
MFSHALVSICATALLLSPAVATNGIYSKNSPVLQIDARSYDKLIAKSNQVSILEFYAPWCGHCQHLKPAYEKAAKGLDGLAQVAAINCDEESNKQFCASMGVQGFPTLKLIKPSKKAGKPSVEDYQGARTAKGIIEAVKSGIPNHVKRISNKGLDAWLKGSNDTSKAILFSDKGSTSALIKVLAAEFVGRMNFAQIRDKDTAAIEMFGVMEFPTLLVLPGGERPPVQYDGLFSKKAMLEFLNQYALAAAEPMTKKPKPSPKKSTETVEDAQKSTSDASAFSEASSSHASSEASEAAAGATSVTLEEESNPTESPDPIATSADAPTPVAMPDLPPPIPTLVTAQDLQTTCLDARTSTCILALLPPLPDAETTLPESATTALASLAELAKKHAQRGTKLFPFYSVPATNPSVANLRELLGLIDESAVELVAVNARRSWWRHYGSENYGLRHVEDWIDAIRLGEGQRSRLPEGLVSEEKPADEDEAAAAEHDEL